MSAGKSNSTVCPTRIVACAGVNVFACIVNTAATDPVVTVNDTGCDDTTPAFPVIVADPGATPSTRPDEFTVATDAADDVYVMVAGTVSPFTSRAIAVSCTASPTAIVCLGAVSTTESTPGEDGLESPQPARTHAATIRYAVRMIPREELRRTPAMLAGRSLHDFGLYPGARPLAT